MFIATSVLHEPGAHARELPRHAAVVHGAADLGDDAADDRRVDLGRDDDPGAGGWPSDASIAWTLSAGAAPRT